MIDIEQVVVHGRKLGRALGFPTANMSLEGYKNIERGVYRSSVEINGTLYRAMSNVGIRPSVGGKELLLETHVIGFSGDLYGKKIEVEFLYYMRDFKSFVSTEELKLQLDEDKKMRKLGGN